jgi:hypothetical protein
LSIIMNDESQQFPFWVSELGLKTRIPPKKS